MIGAHAACVTALADAKEAPVHARLINLLLLMLATCASTALVRAEDAFFRVPLGELKLVEGRLPPDRAGDGWAGDFRANPLRPYAVLDGGGEAFVVPADLGRDAPVLLLVRQCVLV